MTMAYVSPRASEHVDLSRRGRFRIALALRFRKIKPETYDL